MSAGVDQPSEVRISTEALEKLLTGSHGARVGPGGGRRASRILEAVVVAMITSAVTAVVVAGWGNLQRIVADELQSGAVIAIDDPQGCPEGWSSFQAAEGRFIIGAGQEYEHLSVGGSEEVVLTDLQTPNEHSHDSWFVSESLVNPPPGSPLVTVTAGISVLPRIVQPHENRPPYLALFFCRKD